MGGKYSHISSKRQEQDLQAQTKLSNQKTKKKLVQLNILWNDAESSVQLNSSSQDIANSNNLKKVDVKASVTKMMQSSLVQNNGMNSVTTNFSYHKNMSQTMGKYFYSKEIIAQRKKSEQVVNEGRSQQKGLRQFNLSTIKNDRSMQDIVSGYFTGLIQQKEFRPAEYSPSYSYNEYSEDRSYYLKQFQITQLLSEEQEVNKSNKVELVNRVWVGELETPKIQKVTLTIMYMKHNAEKIKFHENMFLSNKILQDKLINLKQINIVKIYYTLLYKRKIFLDQNDYVLIKIEENTNTTMYSILQHRRKQMIEAGTDSAQDEEFQDEVIDKPDSNSQKPAPKESSSQINLTENSQNNRYKEQFYRMQIKYCYHQTELITIMYDLAKALYEAKKQNIYHGSINDESIVYCQDSRIYKLRGFLYYQYDQNQRIDISEQKRKFYKNQI